MKKVSKKTFLGLLDLFRSNDESLKGKTMWIKNNLKDFPSSYYVTSEIKPSQFQTNGRLYKKASETVGLRPEVLTKMFEMTCNVYFISAAPITIDTENKVIKSIPEIEFLPISKPEVSDEILIKKGTGITNSRGDIYVQILDTEDVIHYLEQLSYNPINN